MSRADEPRAMGCGPGRCVVFGFRTHASLDFSRARLTVVSPMAKVYFYYAAMNAGKSTVLLQSSYNYRERGMRSLLFTPAIDNRYGTGRIESRIGLRSGAISIAAADNLLARVRQEHTMRPVACVLVDE